MRRGGKRGHVLIEALAGGALLAMAIAGLASGEVQARRQLARTIEETELQRAATERLEFLLAEPLTSAAWTAPSNGTVAGHPDWTWTILPTTVTDNDVDTTVLPIAPTYRRATVTVTSPSGRSSTQQVLRW